jgi:hypothetical protein
MICVIVRGERARPSAATAVRRANTTHPPCHHLHHHAPFSCVNAGIFLLFSDFASSGSNWSLAAAGVLLRSHAKLLPTHHCALLAL